MDRNSIKEYCLQFPDAKEDYPFDNPDTMILRHKSNRKWFAMLIELRNETCLNVKANPYQVDALCETYKGIEHGWHMNKRHWLTIHLNSDVPLHDIQDMIKESYDLTLTKKRKNDRYDRFTYSYNKF